MGRDWTAKSFKSGNSTALRIPAAAGIAPGEDWRLIEDGQGFRLERIARPGRKFNINKVWGCATGSGLHFLREEDRAFAPRALLLEDSIRVEKMNSGE